MHYIYGTLSVDFQSESYIQISIYLINNSVVTCKSVKKNYFSLKLNKHINTAISELLFVVLVLTIS